MLVKELFNDAPLAGNVVIPLRVQQLLNEPIDVTRDWVRAESLLESVSNLLPGRLEVMVALYKMYAYSNQFDRAFEMIDRVMAEISVRSQLPEPWTQVMPDSANWFPANGDLRIYLYSLKAMGFVALRSGQIEEAVSVLAKLEELDPWDQVGGSVVRDIAEGLLD